jgi:hypothetical protein
MDPNQPKVKFTRSKPIRTPPSSLNEEEAQDRMSHLKLMIRKHEWCLNLEANRLRDAQLELELLLRRYPNKG